MTKREIAIESCSAGVALASCHEDEAFVAGLRQRFSRLGLRGDETEPAMERGQNRGNCINPIRYSPTHHSSASAFRFSSTPQSKYYGNSKRRRRRLYSKFVYAGMELHILHELGQITLFFQLD
jgi:hypothetical protein